MGCRLLLAILRWSLRARLASCLCLLSSKDRVRRLLSLCVLQARTYSGDIILHQKTLMQLLLLQLKWVFGIMSRSLCILSYNEIVLSLWASSNGVYHWTHWASTKLTCILPGIGYNPAIYRIMRSKKHLVCVGLLSSGLIKLQRSIFRSLLWGVVRFHICCLLQVLRLLLASPLLLKCHEAIVGLPILTIWYNIWIHLIDYK